MSAGNLGMLEYGAGALGPLAINPGEAEACARLIARYARTPDDGDQIADVLGLNEGVRFWSERQLAARIMRLADSIGAAS